MKDRLLSSALVLVAGLMSACATMESLVVAPTVSLRNVEATAVDFGKQTFLLSFDVTNPNPFPLPVNEVTYDVRLDGHRFASGGTMSDFTVQAGSDAAFAISVDLDLLRTAPQLLFIVKDAAERDIPYELEGRFVIDLPFAEPVAFTQSGEIHLSTQTF